MVEDYDRWSLFLLLLTCHQSLHLMLEFEIVVDWTNNEDSCIDIFEMFVGTSGLVKELVIRKL